MTPAPGAPRTLSPNVAALGVVSLLMGMSSAMIHGLLPVFLVTVLSADMMMVGVIEGMAEATTSLVKILSGTASDWLRRRKPLVVLGYALSAASKLLFPLATLATTVLVARITDRIGKGIRDAPRDALLVDVTPPGSRGSGFGLRLALYTVGAIVGPLTAMALMVLSDGDFRLVFAVAAIPAFASVAALLLWVTEPAAPVPGGERRPLLRRGDLARLPPAFWWAIAVASLLALARCSYAFLILGAHHAGVDAALVPLMLVLMHVVYSAAAYPCGVLADRSDRRRQLGVGILVLIAADLALAADGPVWLVAVGAGLWGLQLGVTQGLLSAAIADAAPEDLRGTSFGIYETAIGVATFLASAGAGLLWAMAGPAATFGTGAAIAAAAGILLLLRPAPGAAAR